MNIHQLKYKVLVPLVLQGVLLCFATAQAAGVDTSGINKALGIVNKAHKAAQTSQVKIDKLSDVTSERVEDYKTEAKIVDGLIVYNAQLKRQIAKQKQTIKQLDVSIDQVTIINRQIGPLMEKMLASLERFVELDLPFSIDERRSRLDFVKNAIENPNVEVSEKFRQVLQAYQIENNYGRTMSTYSDILPIEGVDREVNILRVGRISLLYQTTDQLVTGAYDKESRRWVEVGGAYRNPVRSGIRMAKKLETVGILDLPIAAPELVK